MTAPMSPQRFSEVAAVVQELVPCTTAELWLVAEELLIEAKRMIQVNAELERRLKVPDHTTS